MAQTIDNITEIRKVIKYAQNYGIDLLDFIRTVEVYTKDDGRCLHVVAFESLKNFRRRAAQISNDILKNVKMVCERKKFNVKKQYEEDTYKLNIVKDNALNHIKKEHPQIKIEEYMNVTEHEARPKLNTKLNTNKELRQYHELYTRLLRQQKFQGHLEKNIHKLSEVLELLRRSLLTEISEYRDLVEVEDRLRTDIVSLKLRLQNPKIYQRSQKFTFSKNNGFKQNEIGDDINLLSFDTFTNYTQDDISIFDGTESKASSNRTIDFGRLDSLIDTCLDTEYEY